MPSLGAHTNNVSLCGMYEVALRGQISLIFLPFVRFPACLDILLEFLVLKDPGVLI